MAIIINGMIGLAGELLRHNRKLTQKTCWLTVKQDV